MVESVRPHATDWHRLACVKVGVMASKPKAVKSNRRVALLFLVAATSWCSFLAPIRPDAWGKCHFEFFVDDDVSLPLTIRWGNDRDVIVSRIGLVSIPFEEVRYDYTLGSKRVTGTIPAREKREWYMHITSDGITINQ